MPVSPGLSKHDGPLPPLTREEHRLQQRGSSGRSLLASARLSPPIWLTGTVRHAKSRRPSPIPSSDHISQHTPHNVAHLTLLRHPHRPSSNPSSSSHRTTGIFSSATCLVARSRLRLSARIVAPSHLSSTFCQFPRPDRDSIRDHANLSPPTFDILANAAFVSIRPWVDLNHIHQISSISEHLLSPSPPHIARR